MNVLYVFIGGGLGSIARFGISHLFMKYITISFPVGTFISNTIACLILGVISYYFPQKEASQSLLQPFLVVGFCGGFSTFSTFSNDTLQLINNGNYIIASANVVFSIATGILSIYLLQKGS